MASSTAYTSQATTTVNEPSIDKEIQMMRRQSRHRLIGAVILALAALIAAAFFFKSAPPPDISSQPEVEDSSVVPTASSLADGEEVLPSNDGVAIAPPTTPSGHIVQQPNTNAVVATAPPATPDRAQQPVIAVPTAPMPIPSVTVQPPITVQPPVTPQPAIQPSVSVSPHKQQQQKDRATMRAQAKARAEQQSIQQQATLYKKAAKTENSINKEKSQQHAVRQPSARDITAKTTPPSTHHKAAQPKPSRTEAERSKKQQAQNKKTVADTATAKSKAATLPDTGRLVVQIGAYTDEASIKKVRTQLSGAGIDHFIQTIPHKGKKITRVRVGPFKTRAEADKAIARVKKAGLQASILSL